MKADRINCQVPACPNGSAKFAGFYGYLCSRHWREVPRWMKRRRAALAALLRRRGELTNEGGYVPLTDRAQRLMCRAWDGMVRAVVTRSAGL